MTFWEHIEELRKVIMRILWIFGITFALTTYFVDNITEWLLAPMRESLALSKSGVMVYHSIFEKAWVQVDVAIWWSIMFSSPLWFFEIWRFIRPALLDHEAKAVKPFMIFGWFLFAAGMGFGYYVAFPAVFGFLAKVGVGGIEANINLRDYVSTMSQILLFLGIIFQVPNILLILGFMGIVTKQSLRSFRRYIYVGLAVFAAICSPPDVISMLGVWVPCVLLFEFGVLLVAWIVHPYLKAIHMKDTEL